MDIPENLVEVHGIQERIIKTDEVIRLLDLKKKEVNKLDKKYKKILERFCSKSKDLTNLNSSWEKKHGDLLIQNELLVKNHNEYLNDAEKKYQSACQEIESLRKKIEKFDHKDKVRNTKKLQDALNQAKEQLCDSLCKYSLLENTTNKTISDLKEKTKGLEQRQNETLKQLAKLRLEYDSLKKSQENSPILRKEIEELETKLESSEIELDILKQSHETDITELKKQYEKENTLFKDKIEKYKNDLFKERNKEKHQENKALEDQYKSQRKLIEDQLEKLNNHIIELTKRHENEKKVIREEYINETNLLTKQLDQLKYQVNKEKNGTNREHNDDNRVAELTKKYQSEKQVLEEQLEELKRKLNVETPSIQETSTQTDEVINEKSGTNIEENDDNKVAELVKKYQNEKQVLEEQLEELKRKINEETPSIQETSTQTDEVNNEKSGTNIEENDDNRVAELVKKCQNEKQVLEEQLEELKRKINEETPSIQETSTQTDEVNNEKSGTNIEENDDNRVAELVKKYQNEKQVLEEQLEELKRKINVETPSIQETSTQTDEVNNEKSGTNIEENDDNRVAELVKKCQNEKQVLEEQLEELKRKINEETLSIQETSTQPDEVNNEKSGTNIEENDDNRVAELAKKCQNEKQVLEEKLEELKRKINEKTPSIQEISTQTDDEDIYNLEDILTEMHDMPVLISPLSVENEVIDKKSSCSVAVGSDDLIPTFTDSFTEVCTNDFLLLSHASTQTDFYQNKIKVKSFNVIEKMKSNSSVATATNVISLTHSSTQTIDSIYNSQSEIEIKFQPSVVKIPKNNVFEKIPKNVLQKSRITKRYKNTANNKLLNSLKNSKLNLKFLVEKCIDTNSKFIIVSPSILKSQKSKINNTHSFTSNTECNFPHCNSDQFLNRNKLIPCSCQLGIYWNRCVPFYPCNYSHSMCCNNKPNNYCTMKKSISNNFDDSANSSDDDEDDRLREVLNKYKRNLIKKYVTDKYLSKLTKIKKKVVLDDSEDDDLLNFLDNIMKGRRKSSKKREKLKHKSTNYKRILTSDSEEENDTIIFSPNKKNKIRKKSKSIIKINSKKHRSNPSFDLQENILQEKEQFERIPSNNALNNSCLDFTDTSNIENSSTKSDIAKKVQNNKIQYNKEINNSTGITLNLENNCDRTNSGKNRNLSKISNESSARVEVNKRDYEIQPVNINSRTSENFTNLQENHTNFLTLSKRQRLLLRKTTMLRGNKVINSSCKKTSKKLLTPISNTNTTKKRMSDICEPDYKKQKLELFGISSDSDSSRENECEKKSSDSINCDRSDKNTLSSNLVHNEFDKINENIENIINDYSSTSNMSSVATNEKLIKSGINILFSSSDKQKHSSNNDDNLVTLTATNKIFKKPQLKKINLPSCNIMKNKKECQMVSTNVKDLSDTESVEFITTKSVSTETKNEGMKINRLQAINLGHAEELIRNVATNDWDKELIITASNYLENKDPAIVGRLIVNQAAKDLSQKFDKSYTPPAPLLTTSQQKILVLLDHLEKRNLRNIYLVFLEVLERRLLSEIHLEVVHSLTRLYVTACKLKYDIEKIRMFCCNSAYYMGDLILPVMFIVLTTWGDVLPMAENADDIPLATALVQVIQLKACIKPGYNGSNLNRLLSDYYGYKLGEHSNEKVINELIQYYSATYSNIAYTAIVILCKNLPNKWTYTQIKSNLLPLINNCENNENKMKTVSLIQRLIDKFDKNKNEDYITEISNCLSNYVISTRSGAILPGGS